MSFTLAKARASVVRFARLPRSEKSVFVSAVLATNVVRLAFFVLPVQRIIIISDQLSRRWPARRKANVTLARAARRIVQARRWCPFSTCLSETIAAGFVLSRLGHETELRIGVAKPVGKFEAHAWLECPDGIVIGNVSPEGKNYVRMPSLPRFVA